MDSEFLGFAELYPQQYFATPFAGLYFAGFDRQVGNVQVSLQFILLLLPVAAARWDLGNAGLHYPIWIHLL